jgi:xanthine/uracil permease
LIATILQGVLGGLAIVLFGLIGATRGYIWVQNQVDFSRSRNLITAAVALTMGGIANATFSAIIIYQVLRERELKPEEISTADSAVGAGE